MEAAKEFIVYLIGNYDVVAAALGGLIAGVVGVLVLIPGDQGESKLMKIANKLKGLKKS